MNESQASEAAAETPLVPFAKAACAEHGWGITAFLLSQCPLVNIVLTLGWESLELIFSFCLPFTRYGCYKYNNLLFTVDFLENQIGSFA